MTVDAQIALLSASHRADINALHEAMVQIDRARRAQRREIIEQISASFNGKLGFSAKSLYRKYRTWRAAGRTTSALINRAAQRGLVKRHPVSHCYKTYCERNQRSSRAAWRAMISDLISGASLPHGVGTWRNVYRTERGIAAVIPDRCPYTHSAPPIGWTYGHLQHSAGLSRFESTAARVGMQAARSSVLPVLTTRVGMHLGQYLQFDDKWHDVKVNFPGQKAAIRPLEFVCRDVLSTFAFARGIRPRIVDEETGRAKNLNEREMRFMAVHVLTEVGVYREGSTWIVEHGTSAFSDDDFARVNRIAPGLIRPERSGILSEQVHRGMWSGSQGGNFRLKAALESAHNLEHNELAALPGQIGRNRDNSPESTAHLDAYNTALLRAAAKLSPERRALLRWPLLPFSQYVEIAMDIYDRIEDCYQRDLEGWSQCGFETAEYRLGEGSHWFPMSSLDGMDSAQRGAIEAFLAANPQHTAVRNMTAREVRNKFASDLTTLPLYCVPDILRREDGLAVRVYHDGTIQFRERYIGDGLHVFHGTVVTPTGYHQRLSPGADYWAFITPYQPDKLFVTDISSGAILGIAPRYDRAPRYEIDAVRSLMGQQAHDRAEKSTDVRGRHQDEADQRAALIAHNDAVMAGAPVTSAERAAAAAARGIDLNDEIRRERELLERQERNNQPTEYSQ